MDEPEQHEPEQHEPGQPTGPGPTDPTSQQVPPPTRGRRVRGALAGRAAGWVAAAALAGAVVALSVVLATSPSRLHVRALPGLTAPARIVAIPPQPVQVPAGRTGPGRVVIGGTLPSLTPQAWCMLGTAPRSFRVAVPPGPAGQPLARKFVILRGGARLAPATVCPPA